MKNDQSFKCLIIPTRIHRSCRKCRQLTISFNFIGNDATISDSQHASIGNMFPDTEGIEMSESQVDLCFYSDIITNLIEVVAEVSPSVHDD